MKSGKQPHILNASSNLIGICFILITGLKISGAAKDTLVDEVSIVAAFMFMSSCLLSYISLRRNKVEDICEKSADALFLSGLVMMFVAVVLFSFGMF